MELRIVRKHIGDYGHPEHVDRLQYLAPVNTSGYGTRMEWRDVPIVDEYPSNKSLIPDDPGIMPPRNPPDGER
jgi:hypothetical protein